jgi:hypothetical protein
MRKISGILVAAALLVPVGAIATPAGAAGGTTCKTVSGAGTLKPGFPNTTAKAKPVITTKNAKLGTCSGGGVTAGTLSATLKTGVAGNCASVLAKVNLKIVGTVAITWKPSGTSTVKVATLAPTPKPAPPTQLKLSGKVTAGKFVGSTMTSLITFTPGAGQCGTKPLTSATFKQAKPLTIK